MNKIDIFISFQFFHLSSTFLSVFISFPLKFQWATKKKCTLSVLLANWYITMGSFFKTNGNVHLSFNVTCAILLKKKKRRVKWDLAGN